MALLMPLMVGRLHRCGALFLVLPRFLTLVLTVVSAVSASGQGVPPPLAYGQCSLCFNLDMSQDFAYISKQQTAALLAAAAATCGATFAVTASSHSTLQVCSRPGPAAAAAALYAAFSALPAQSVRGNFTANPAIGMDCLVGCCDAAAQQTDPYCLQSSGFVNILTISSTCNGSLTAPPLYPAQCSGDFDCLPPGPSPPEGAWPPALADAASPPPRSPPPPLSHGPSTPVSQLGDDLPPPMRRRSPPASPPPTAGPSPPSGNCSLCFNLDMSQDLVYITQTRIDALVAAASAACGSSFGVAGGDLYSVKICSPAGSAGAAEAMYAAVLTMSSAAVQRNFTANAAIGMDCIVGCCDDAAKQTDPYCLQSSGFVNILTVSSSCNGSLAHQMFPFQCQNHFDCLPASPPPPAPGIAASTQVPPPGRSIRNPPHYPPPYPPASHPPHPPRPPHPKHGRPSPKQPPHVKPSHRHPHPPPHPPPPYPPHHKVHQSPRHQAPTPVAGLQRSTPPKPVVYRQHKPPAYQPTPTYASAPARRR